LARYRLGHTEQHAAVKLEGAGPEIVNRPEELRSDTKVLLAARSEMAKDAGLTIGLKSGLDDPGVGASGR
jgi:hypothetical protein